MFYYKFQWGDKFDKYGKMISEFIILYNQQNGAHILLWNQSSLWLSVSDNKISCFYLCQTIKNKSFEAKCVFVIYCMFVHVLT